MASIELKGLKKIYGSQQVVHDLDLSISDGEFVVLVGPSGCAKSTVLRMVAGLEVISAGTVLIGNRIVNDLPPQHRNLAMVFQNYALYPHKSVRENIIFGLKKTSLSKAQIQDRLNKAATLLQLEDYLDRKPAALSGGQRQRVAMGRAIVRDVDLFLFDEPLSNLDAKLRHEMRTEIRKLHKAYRTTSIYVTHDQTEAMTLADRVVVMRSGRIEQVGRPMDIYLNPANVFTASFIGSPSMNLLDAKLDANSLLIGDLKLDIPPAFRLLTAKLVPHRGERRIILGLRPELMFDLSLKEPTVETIDFGYVSIDLVEPLGFDKDVTVTVGGKALLARLDLRSDAIEGSKLHLGIETSQVHVFDPETKENLIPFRPLSARPSLMKVLP